MFPSTEIAVSKVENGYVARHKDEDGHDRRRVALIGFPMLVAHLRESFAEPSHDTAQVNVHDHRLSARDHEALEADRIREARMRTLESINSDQSKTIRELRGRIDALEGKGKPARSAARKKK